MTPEERKIYNSNYYRNNIEKQKNNNEYIIECELCGKKVIKSSLNKHLKTNYCKKHYEIRLYKMKKLNALKENNI